MEEERFLASEGDCGSLSAGPQKAQEDETGLVNCRTREVAESPRVHRCHGLVERDEHPSPRRCRIKASTAGKVVDEKGAVPEQREGPRGLSDGEEVEDLLEEAFQEPGHEEKRGEEASSRRRPPRLSLPQIAYGDSIARDTACLRDGKGHAAAEDCLEGPVGQGEWNETGESRTGGVGIDAPLERGQSSRCSWFFAHLELRRWRFRAIVRAVPFTRPRE
jgi:hypothetical protein